MPTNDRPIRPPTKPIHMPGVDIDHVHPVLLPQIPGNLRRDRLPNQRPNRRPNRSDAKLLPGDPISHRRRVISVAVDIGWRGIRYQYTVFGLNWRKLVGRILQYGRMTHDNHLRPNRTVAQKQFGPATT